ncbi:MAG TPA: hypothetical protein VN253_08905 [Kofleriaceae bacterium]|nr:hypothetical protein [Kofleriaceae bacterium]
MAASYDDAVIELHQVPHAAFVGERKRLAAELRAAGDKAGAAQLAKLPRPPVSAWVVNQLWWHARDAFEAMLAAAERVRGGELAATAAHREAIGRLRARGAAILADGGHGANEAVLRRVTTTLAAIAAAGGFAPDPAGALGEDRDPPGFETMGLAFPVKEDGEKKDGEEKDGEKKDGEKKDGEEKDGEKKDGEREEKKGPVDRGEAEAARRREAEEAEKAEEARRHEAEAARRREAEEARARAEAAAERRRIEQETARKQAERQRLEAALRTATGEMEHLQREIARLRGAVADAEDKLERARVIAADLEARLAEV